MIAPCLMSAKHVAIRKFKGNYGAIAQAIDGYILEYFLFSMITIVLVNDPIYTFRWADIGVGMVAGVLMSVGRALLAVAIQIGIAAAAQSLMSTHAVWQAFWGVVIGGQIITWLQGLGVGLSILGVIVISCIKLIINKLFPAKKAPEGEKTENKVADSTGVPASPPDSNDSPKKE